MGAEALRASLSYESMRASAVNQVKVGRTPKLLKGSFSAPDLKALDLDSKNPNVCRPEVVAELGGGTGVACAALSESSFVVVRTLAQVDSDVAEIEANLFTEVCFNGIFC